MLAPLCLAVASFAAEPRPRALDKATVLPLALDDAYQFRKTITFLNDPEVVKPAADAMINFERAYINYGAINSFERRQRTRHCSVHPVPGGPRARRRARQASGLETAPRLSPGAR